MSRSQWTTANVCKESGTTSPAPAAQLTVVGDRFTVRFRSGDVYSGIFTLDATSKPKSMDMLVMEGPERHQGKNVLGIYALDGDRLIWCVGEPGGSDRPRYFPPRSACKFLCLVLERV